MKIFPKQDTRKINFYFSDIKCFQWLKNSNLKMVDPQTNVIENANFHGPYSVSIHAVFEYR